MSAMGTYLKAPQ